MSALDLRTVEYSASFDVVAPSIGVRPVFVLDLRAGWDVIEGYHVQGLKELCRQCRGLGRMTQLYRPGADENMYYLHEWSPSTSRKLEQESCQAAFSTYSQT